MADFSAYLVQSFECIDHLQRLEKVGTGVAWSQTFKEFAVNQDQYSISQLKQLSAESINGQWLREMTPNGDADRFLEVARSICNGRRLFLTSRYWLGLGPSSMEGDFLCVLGVGALPFILRPEDGHYRLVGECYVEGLMNGEAVEEANRTGSLSEWFELW